MDDAFERGYALALDRVEALLKGAKERGTKQAEEVEDREGAGHYDDGFAWGQVRGIGTALDLVQQVRENQQ